MMKYTIRLAIIGLLIIVAGMACSKSNADADRAAARDMRNDASATLDKARDTLDEASRLLDMQMAQFRSDMNANLATTDTQLQQFQARRDAQADANTQAAMDARLAELKAERDALQLRLDQADSHKKDQADWDNFEKETQTAWHDLENGIKDSIDWLGG